MPAQSENINFIPDQIRHERRRDRNKNMGTRVSLILATVTSLVAAGLFYYNWTVNSKIEGYIKETEEKTSQIEDLKTFGEEGYRLGIRLENIKTILESRGSMSYLMSELLRRVPAQQVSITELTYNTAQGLTLKCEAESSYRPIDVFTQNLLEVSASGDPSVFSKVKLIEALYDKNDGIVQFTLNIEVDQKLLANVQEVDDGSN